MESTTAAVTAEAVVSEDMTSTYKAPPAQIDWQVLGAVVSLILAVGTLSGSIALIQYLATFCVDPGWAGCAQTLPMTMVALGAASFFVTGMVLSVSVLALSKAHGKLDLIISNAAAEHDAVKARPGL